MMVMTKMLENPKKVLFYRAKTHAKAKNIPFNIRIDDIPDIPSHCPILHFELGSIVPKNGEHHRYNAPSIDRIDSDLGYVPGNIQIISWRANDLKSTGTVDDFKNIVAHLVSGQTMSGLSDNDPNVLYGNLKKALESDGYHDD